MTERTITCPSCSTEIKLTESLAAPPIRATREEYEAKIAQKYAELSTREAQLRAEADAIEEARRSIDEQVRKQLTAGRAAIAAEEAKKASRCRSWKRVKLRTGPSRAAVPSSLCRPASRSFALNAHRLTPRTCLSWPSGRQRPAWTGKPRNGTSCDRGPAIAATPLRNRHKGRIMR